METDKPTEQAYINDWSLEPNFLTEWEIIKNQDDDNQNEYAKIGA